MCGDDDQLSKVDEMGYKLSRPIFLSEIANKLGLAFRGVNIQVCSVNSVDLAREGDLSFVSSSRPVAPGVALIGPDGLDIADRSINGQIISQNPRLDFMRALNYFSGELGFVRSHAAPVIDPTAVIGKNVVIEDGCVVGANSIIEHNVVLSSGTKVGARTIIRSGSCVGGPGFGYERLDDGSLLRFIHLGGVVIGDDVEVGALNSIACGSLSDTVIEDNVKTDNLVHIAHNCIIGSGSLIAACAEFSGGVRVGKGVWVGPNASIMQKKSLGDGSIIGLGAVVTKDVPSFTVFAGNPARKIRDI